MARVGEELSASITRLAQAGVDSPALDAQLLMAHALNCSRLDVIAHPEHELSDIELQGFAHMLDSRADRYPLAYILGYREFYGLDLIVSPGVLIPRPDTETLVEAAIQRLSRLSHPPTIADIGAGSGAIAIAIAVAVPNAQVYTTEISPQAAKVARANIEKHAMGDRVKLIEGDMLEPLLGMEFDAIVSNPPYIPTADIDTLEPEVRLYEPREALDGGTDGLDAYRVLLPGALPLLRADGFAAMEVGAGQARAVAEMAGDVGYLRCEIEPDLAGIERVVVAWKC
ncbi:MAG: peptide chain release factor N(5)-glutamine methyltransferase [Armatimonadota bacterium]|nr:peptide chain release factor N(5)-glutamine methyltransferase [bacterium]